MVREVFKYSLVVLGVGRCFLVESFGGNSWKIKVGSMGRKKFEELDERSYL